MNVFNLPIFVPRALVRQRVEQLAENCGGKMVHMANGSIGVIKFSSRETAQR